ncbi:MAG: DedA family protein [Kineosporiaceae bacterium]
MSGVLDGLHSVPPTVAYLVIFLLVFGEAAVFVGFVLPGETAVVLGGVLASQHDLRLGPLIALVVVAAVLGDSVGYEVGRHFGDRLLGWRRLRRHGKRLDGARDYLRDRGAYAVFLGRWTAFLRAAMPGLAGASRMPYRRFLAWNAVGGLVWGVTFSLVGYLSGASYHLVERRLGTASAGVSLVIVLGVLLGWHWRRRRERNSEAEDGSSGASPEAPPGNATRDGTPRNDTSVG